MAESGLKKNSDCELCDLCDNATEVCQWGSGLSDSGIMVVAESPDSLDGEARDVLDRALDYVGLKDSVYVTYAVKCEPEEGKKPKAKELKTCKQYLDREIYKVKPKHIILLGNIALKAVLGQTGIMKLRGQQIEEDGITYHPIYSPGFIIRDNRYESTFMQDVKNIARVAVGLEMQEGPKENVKIVNSWKSFRKALKWIKRQKELAFDTETSGLDQWDPGGWVTSIGLGNDRRQYTILLQHKRGFLAGKYEAQKRLVHRLHDILRRKRLIAHNGKFDHLWIRILFGHEWWCWWDTMLAHHNLDENDRHGLDYIATKKFRAGSYDVPLSVKHGLTGTRKEHCTYLAKDILYTWLLYKDQKISFKTDKPTWLLFKNLTMPVSDLYCDVEFNGVYLEPKTLNRSKKYWEKKERKYLKKLNSYVPGREWKDKKDGNKIKEGINWNSPDQVGVVLFDELGLKPLDFTPTGKRQVNESVLLRLKHKICKQILDYRGAFKNLSTFIYPWLEKQTDNYIHPSFLIHGTVTGRPSCKDPNLQQTARDPRIRAVISAPPGWTLIEADYSQAELRGMAEMSGDIEMKMAFNEGLDIHTLTCQRIMGIPEPTKEERKKAKAVNFGFIYGQWWKGFIKYARDKFGIIFSPSKAKKTRINFFNTFTSILPFHKDQIELGKKFGFVRSLFGRKRRLPILKHARDRGYEYQEACRQSYNAPIQSYASDLTLMAAVELRKIFRGCDFIKFCGTVHDSIHFRVRDDKIEYVAKTIIAVMKEPPLIKVLAKEPLRVPIVGEITYGPWSKGTEWKPGQKINVDPIDLDDIFKNAA